MKILNQPNPTPRTATLTKFYKQESNEVIDYTKKARMFKMEK